MKTLMKISVVGFFSLIAFAATAQSKSVGGRPVSKAVQKVSNKWLSDEQLVTVASHGYPTLVLSKDVHRISNRLSKQLQEGNMISIGYPYWIIQKRVHQIAKP